MSTCGFTFTDEFGNKKEKTNKNTEQNQTQQKPTTEIHMQNQKRNTRRNESA